MKKFPLHILAIFIAIVIFGTASASAQIASTNIEVTASPKQSSVGRIGVTLSGVELEDAFQRQSKSRGLNPAVFREELVSSLKELHPGTIRMEFPDLGQQLAGELSISGATLNGGSVSSSRYGLGEFLQLCVEAGSDPWIQIPSGTTPEQMRELMQYLSGTGSDAWTAARIAGGQSDPWTQVFGKIHVELSNESGTAAAVSEHMEAGTYAARANADFGAARQVAGFDGSKFDLMLSGTGVSAQWATEVLAQSREQNSVAITADLPWRAAGAQPSELFGVLLAEPEAMDSTGGILSREVTGLAMTASANGTSVNVARSQLSLAAGGSEQLAQSWGASLAQAEHVLQMTAMGVRYQNGAVLTESNLHCVSASQTANCRSAQLLTAALANGAIGGTMLQTLQTGTNPSWSQVVSGEPVQAHALQSFAFTEGSKVSLVIFNLSRTAELPLTLSGANGPAGDVQLAQIAPREITASNQSGADLQPSTQTLSASEVSGGLSLPPFSMTVLSWEAGSRERTVTPPVTETVKVPSAMAKPYAADILAALPAASASTTSSQPVINCPNGFTSTAGSCQVVLGGCTKNGGCPYFSIINGEPGSLVGNHVLLIPTGQTHASAALNWMNAKVNAQAFTSTFTFVPNGWNIAFVLSNNTNDTEFSGAIFAAGAGCEGGFFQAFQDPVPNNVFAIELDQWSSLTAGANNFTYSSVQTYVSGQSPCNPNLNEDPYISQNKISTYPVPLNSPANAINTTTGDTYSATVTYDGSNLTLNLYDITAGGSCPGAKCFTNTWTGVNIPAAINSNTAWLGLTASTNSSVPNLYVDSLVYTENSGTPTAATPTFSVPAGTYATSQTVSISDATSGAAIYYTTNGSTPTTSSTKYTGAITVSSPETLEAIAVVSGYSNSAVATAIYTISPVVAAPTFSPVGGTYTSSQTVTISDSTAGAIIYYTTNGTAPTTSSTVYSGPIMVSASETVGAIAVSTGTAASVKAALVKANASAAANASSPIATAAYTIDSVLPAPSFSPAAGTYTTAQSVTISDATAGTTTYYTTNGSTPTTSSTTYTGAITVSATETLAAIAVKTGYANSPVATAAFTVTANTGGNGYTYINNPNGVFYRQAFYLNGATVTSAKVVQLTDGYGQEGRSAWFRAQLPIQRFITDFTFQQLNAAADGMTFTIQGQGSTALGSAGGSLGYAGITKSVAVKFDLYNNAGEGTDSTGLYTDGAQPMMPAVDLTSTGVVLRSGDVMHAHIVYDGTNLTLTLTDTVTNATATEVFPVNIPSLVGGNMAYVGFTGGTGGATATQNILSWTYTVPPAQTAATPTFSVAAGTYTTAQTVSISEAAAGATIYYTTNGTTPTTSSTKYTGAITVSASETLEAIAVATGYTNSPIAAAAYTISSTAAAVAAAPIFSPAAGTYSASQSVVISDATAGTTIYYTTDGSTPTTSSTKYTGALTLSASKTLKAIAVKTGVTNYPVTTAAYTIAPVLPAPAFSVAAGTYTRALSVTISDVTAGTTIYYTTNGTTPTTSSAKYTEAIKVSATEKLQAIAIETSHTNSPVASVAYTIETALPAPAFSVAAGTYTSALSVTISDVTAGATIYYTTNGTTPTTSSVKYTGAITISITEKLEAIAVETGHTDSPVAAVAYTITTPKVAFTVFQSAESTVTK